MVPDRACTIYAWACPDSGLIVYVGKTSVALNVRMAAHRNSAMRHPKTPAHRWLRDLLRAGRSVEVSALEACTVAQSSERERAWIAEFESTGVPLLNVRTGGHGNPGVGRVDWTPARLALLGKVSDRALAAMIGCESSTVGYRRRAHGIAACPQAKPSTTKTLAPSLLSQLGTAPDHRLAKAAGVSKFVIAKHRRRLGIPSFAAATGNDGRIRNGARGRRAPALPAEAIALLGEVPDYVVGQMVGLSSAQISSRRRKLGIRAKRARKWERAAAEGRPRNRRSDFGTSRTGKGPAPGEA